MPVKRRVFALSEFSQFFHGISYISLGVMTKGLLTVASEYVGVIWDEVVKLHCGPMLNKTLGRARDPRANGT